MFSSHPKRGGGVGNATALVIVMPEQGTVWQIKLAQDFTSPSFPYPGQLLRPGAFDQLPQSLCPMTAHEQRHVHKFIAAWRLQRRAD
jgi:hypothetical protein